MSAPTNDLTEAEKKLVKAATSGGPADYRSGDASTDEPANSADWGPERTLRAETIYALAVGSNPNWPVLAKGIEIFGAKIVGVLDFEASELRCNLALVSCHIERQVVLAAASTRSLSLQGSRLEQELVGDGLRSRGSVSLGGVEVRGEVRLAGADIGGQLDCIGATFESKSGRALTGSGIRVRGDVFLKDKFRAKGEVWLPGAYIGGQLICTDATFEGDSGRALVADGIQVRRDVFLSDGFSAMGEVRLIGANIGGVLYCSGATLENQSGIALNAERIKVGGNVSLDNKFSARGEVRLLAADIKGNLDCSAATFENRSSPALRADGIKVGRSVFLNDKFSARGLVRMLGADIGGDLDCNGATLKNHGGIALGADRIKVGGNVWLSDKFRAKGEVRVLGANINGNLTCSGGTFENHNSAALSADRTKVGGSVILGENFSAKGSVSLPGADIGGQLACSGTFENPKAEALSLESAKVAATLLLNFAVQPIGILNLGYASVCELSDRQQTWPAKGNLFLDGFTYERLMVGAPISFEQRREWLSLHVEGDFWPQPYEQLAKTLRLMGHAEEARLVLIEKEDERRRRLRTKLSLRRRAWLWLLKWTVGYGYRPQWIGWWALGIVVLGWALVSIGNQSGLMWRIDRGELQPLDAAHAAEPARERLAVSRPAQIQAAEGLEPLSPFWYSLDVFLPIHALHQMDHWWPRATSRAGHRHSGAGRRARHGRAQKQLLAERTHPW